MWEFFNKGDNRILRSVYKEDVSSLSVSSMSLNPVTWKCSVCPSSHSMFDANEKGGRCVIVLVNQNFPAVLPSSENLCLLIIRLEQGSLDELIDLFVNVTRQVMVPPVRLFCLVPSPAFPRWAFRATPPPASTARDASLVLQKSLR
jgi:hypothetical protein